MMFLEEKVPCYKANQIGISIWNAAFLLGFLRYLDWPSNAN